MFRFFYVLGITATESIKCCRFIFNLFIKIVFCFFYIIVQKKKITSAAPWIRSMILYSSVVTVRGVFGCGVGVFGFSHFRRGGLHGPRKRWKKKQKSTTRHQGEAGEKVKKIEKPITKEPKKPVKKEKEKPSKTAAKEIIIVLMLCFIFLNAIYKNTGFRCWKYFYYRQRNILK